MTDETVVAIARIPLARSTGRMLAAPGLLFLTGAVAAGAGWSLSGWAGLGLMAAGALVAVLAVYMALVVLSARLDVEVSALRLRRIGRDERFTLVRGAVTRVPLRGEGAASLQQRFGAVGWGLGPARLRGEERIQLVRLAPTESVILVPTDGGRVAIAPASEEQLIAALGAAARVQQRLDQFAARARAVPLEKLVEPAPRAPTTPPLREPEPGRILTGIERVMLEERLAAERAAALAAAEQERQLAAEAATARAAAEAAEAARPALAPSARAERARPRLSLQRPGWARPPRPRIGLPAAGAVPRERLLQYLVAALPLVMATAIWVVATVTGRLELHESEARLTGLSLALVGPAAALGALAARAWFPRLLGLVTIASVCALALAGRAIFA